MVMGRVKTCKVCRIRFEPSRPMQSVCSPECALLVAMKKTRQEMLRKASAERQDTLKKRKAMRSMSELRKRAQKAFNAYIRE
ncbi:MAG: recombination protein NinG, partial [Comamonadaceae bacterium]|nr:recombination protein NinG [Comamonadaceae bacterium]